jgi:prephenate dehydrogenase
MSTVGIVGLGLIGGSMAKAFARWEGKHRVLGADSDRSILDFAKLAQAVDGELTPEALPLCDLILLAVYPNTVIEWLRANAARIAGHTLVVDCAGTKTAVCAAAFPLAEQYGFTFVGGHPMAGTQYSGFKHSREELFDRQTMVTAPPRFDDIRLFERVKILLEPLGFGHISVTTAEEHDRVVAFTSQLCHVVSNAYIKSPTAERHEGFSAGSYQDLTRVAALNPAMWSELFVENRAPLLEELDGFIASLAKYRDALEEADAKGLFLLLEEGRRRKRAVDRF